VLGDAARLAGYWAGRVLGRGGAWATLANRGRGRGKAMLGRARVGQRTGPQAELGLEAVFRTPA